MPGLTRARSSYRKQNRGRVEGLPAPFCFPVDSDDGPVEVFAIRRTWPFGAGPIRSRAGSSFLDLHHLDCSTRGLSSTSPFAVDFSPRFTRGESDQFAVLELHPGSVIAVVQNHLDAGGGELVVEGLGELHRALSGATPSGVRHTSNGATLMGHRMPSLSWLCSMTAWSVRVTPMP